MLDEQVERVTLQTEMGEITILANHEPFVGLVRGGEIEIQQNSEIKKLNLGAGVVEVEKDGRLHLLLKGVTKESE